MSLISSHPDYKTFKKLSLQRIEEAKILLNNGAYSGAYYLAGYSVELALKACYCKAIQAQSFPPEKKVYNKLYSHDLNDLRDVSNIKTKFEMKAAKNDKLEVNWGIVKEWNEDSRYSSSIKQSDAQALIDAIIEKEVGILTWIKKVW